MSRFFKWNDGLSDTPVSMPLPKTPSSYSSETSKKSAFLERLPVPSPARRMSKVVERQAGQLGTPITVTVHTGRSSYQVYIKATLDGTLSMSVSSAFEADTKYNLFDLKKVATEGSTVKLEFDKKGSLELEFNTEKGFADWTVAM
jgi:hypothetical protein